MQKFEEVLTIEPANELRFVGPFNRPVVTVMTLKNNSNLILVFKIKTTAPKRYCVRPNIGKIAPFRSTQVEICLQPFIYDQHEKNKHKFMVQSVMAPQDADLTDLNKLWKELEPGQLMDAKLKCVFEMPSSDAKADSSSGAAAGSAATAGNSPVGAEAGKSDTAPKLSSEDKDPNLPDAEYNDPLLVMEIRELQETINELRKENLNLKDQIIRLRIAPKPVHEPYTPAMAEKQIPVFYIALAIASAILGLLLGKFLLGSP